jgi:anti-sigma-K factor RskA
MTEHDDMDTLAGEYVLGVLPADEARAVERRMEADPALRGRVDYWQRRLHGLNALAAPIEPDPTLWLRIERGLEPATVRATKTPWWQGLRLWQATASLAVATSVVLAALLFFLPAPKTDWIYTAVLQSPDSAAGWLVQANAKNEVLLTPLTTTEVGPGRALQFWTLADRAKGPVSLGLVAPDRPVRIPASKLPGVKPGQLFEITLEPSTGSPYNRPSGPILFKGTIVTSS